MTSCSWASARPSGRLPCYDEPCLVRGTCAIDPACGKQFIPSMGGCHAGLLSDPALCGRRWCESLCLRSCSPAALGPPSVAVGGVERKSPSCARRCRTPERKMPTCARCGQTPERKSPSCAGCVPLLERKSGSCARRRRILERKSPSCDRRRDHNSAKSFPLPAPTPHNSPFSFPAPALTSHNSPFSFPPSVPTPHNSSISFPAHDPARHNSRIPFPGLASALQPPSISSHLLEGKASHV